MRKLSDWISSYLDYMQNTESATILHKWTALSVIAACLRKKCSLSIGRINIYPNMYVVFVGPPGAPRKSQAISFGIKFLTDIPDVIVAADATTPQAFLDDLEQSAVDEQLPDGSILHHSSLTITSKELESFLGEKKENTKMVTYLTDLFDAQELPWKYRTKHSGDNIVPSVFLNILAATTPDSIVNCLPSTAIGMGLTSRTMFIWADSVAKRVTYPKETLVERELKKNLQHDLYAISRMVGEFKQTRECQEKWDQWYQHYDEYDRICKEPIFEGWYNRKPLYIQKVALICSASEGEDKIIRWKHFKRAMNLIKEVEPYMPKVFSGMGRSIVVSEVNMVLDIVRKHKIITEHELMSLVWRDIDATKMDNVITTAIKTGRVIRRYVQGGIVFEYR